jgi:hypothetical protein
VVADPLDVAHDPDGREDEAQVLGHRLVERDELEGLLLDRALENVDGTVVADHLLGLGAVARQERAHRLADRFLGLGRGGGEPLLEAGQLLVEVPLRLEGRAHPNLPVM